MDVSLDRTATLADVKPAKYGVGAAWLGARGRGTGGTDRALKGAGSALIVRLLGMLMNHSSVKTRAFRTTCEPRAPS
jgi:hypothetical protein